MESGLLQDVIVRKSAVIPESFVSEYKDPHTDVEKKGKMKSGLLLDVII